MQQGWDWVALGWAGTSKISPQKALGPPEVAGGTPRLIFGWAGLKPPLKNQSPNRRIRLSEPSGEVLVTCEGLLSHLRVYCHTLGLFHT